MELHRRVRYRLLFKVSIKDLIVAVEGAKQGVAVGEDTTSGLMFAGNYWVILETPEGLRRQIEKALEYTRQWRVTVNIKKCAVQQLYVGMIS